MINKDEAIKALMRISYTREEAKKFLDETDRSKRLEIAKSVQKRVKEGYKR